MFGTIMQLKVGSMTIRLAPFTREEIGEFVKNGGMQSHIIIRYLGHHNAFVLDDELEWFDHTRKDKLKIVWGIWDYTDPDHPVLIGNTSLTDITQHPMCQAVSGSMIFRQEYWGKGIATAIHKARTRYGFLEMNLDRIKSAVTFPNTASRKALEHSGYNIHSIERNFEFTDGQLLHRYNLECINPASWSTWWHSDTPSQAAKNARPRVQEAIEWAKQNVTFV